MIKLTDLSSFNFRILNLKLLIPIKPRATALFKRFEQIEKIKSLDLN